MSEEPGIVSTRLTARMKDLIEELIRKDTHLNISEWMRVAAREKLQHDYPEEFESLIKKEEKE